MTTESDSWLQDLSEAQAGVRKALVVRVGPKGDTQLRGVWPPQSPPDIDLLNRCAAFIVQQVAAEQAFAPADGPGRGYAFPLRAADRTVGAVALVLDEGAAESDKTADETAIALLRLRLPALEHAITRPAILEIGPAEVLALQNTLLTHGRYAAAATALANEMAALLGCERVSIGISRSGSARVEAVSHGISSRLGSHDFLSVATAMDECIDQGASIAYPPPPQATPRVSLAHAALSRANGGMPLLSLPLVRDQEVIGALSLEGKTFNLEEIARLEHVVGLLAPLLDLKREAGLPLALRFRRMAARFWHHLTGPGHALLKAGTFGAALLVALIALLPTDYRVTAPVRLEGQVQRILSAPSDGFLQAVHARPGDRVSAGQVLAELAQQDLMLELRRWQSELAQHENAYGAAMSSGNRTELAVSLGKMRQAQSQVDLVQAQLKRASIEAPFDGVVISGDLSQSLGMPVERGHALMTVAPSLGRRLIIEVDERDIAELRSGNTGEFALQALPGQTMQLRVRSITAVASNRNGRNFFAVEADIIGDHAQLRPGLEGVAKIDVGRASLAWIWTHRATDWLRLNLWRWLG